MILVRTPLRISFAGGGSDIPSHYEEHGGAVCSVTINKYIYITAKPNTSLFPFKYRLVYSQVEAVNDRKDIKHPIIKQLVDDYGLGSLDLDVMSDIPAGTGMGSSSAFTVGLHNALGSCMDKYQLAEEACDTEINYLKEPIGKQDQYAASFGGFNFFQFTKDRVVVEPFSLGSDDLRDLRDRINLVWLGGSRSASSILEDQNSRPNTASLCRMTELAREFALALHNRDFDSLGPIVQENWELKKKLAPGITTPRIQELENLAFKNGATGVKLLGAGGAGFMLVVAKAEDSHTIRSALGNTVPFNWDLEGSKVLYED